MGIDWRLYVGTLVAVLIFFGLGVLVGVGLTREPTAQRLERQIRRLEERLARELSRRDERIRELERALSASERHWATLQQWWAMALPLLAAKRLVFRNIALMACAPDADGALLERLKDTLQQAGASVPVTVTFNPDAIQSADAAAWQRLARRLGLVGAEASENALRDAVWKRLALLVRYGDGAGQMNAFAEVGWAKISGSLAVPIGSVVLFVAFQQPRDLAQVQAVDLPLLRALKSVGVRTVACETTALRGNSVVEWLQPVAGATVDHADTPMGMACVVFALAGAPDRYGLKPTARQPLPPPTAFFTNAATPAYSQR